MVEEEFSRVAGLLVTEWKLAVLKCLVDKPGYSYTIRELAKQTPGSYGSVRSFVHDLADAGIVERRKKGNSVLVNYREGHRYEDAVKALLKTETAMLREIAEEYASELKGRDEVASIVLYGSVAKGTAGSDSDIDILVLAEDKEKIEAKARETAREVESRQDASLSVLVEDVEEFRENLETGKRFEQEVLKWGEVTEGKTLPGEEVKYDGGF